LGPLLTLSKNQAEIQKVSQIELVHEINAIRQNNLTLDLQLKVKIN
jgi:hypothetical protein